MFGELEERLGYKFKDDHIVQVALTHRSVQGMFNNERLEFLGDSVLSLIVSNYIFSYKSNLKEGELTKIRSILVCEKSLMKVAEKIDIGSYMRLGKGEKNSGGNKRASILADAVEALIAAMYLDSDFDTVSKYVLSWLEEDIVIALSNKKNYDYKSKLQEEIQKVKGRTIKYEMLDMKGPDHDRTFTIGVYRDDQMIGTGTGRSKKDAEQISAKDALEKMGIL